MVAMCACNTPNFPPMMCNVSVMVVRIWKLHSMHIFVPHLITLRGTNWIRGQHPAIITQGLDTWRSAHSCMSYRGAIPGYYCRVFSKNVNNIQSWHLWLGIMAPRIIAARLEKSEKRNLNIHLVLCNDNGSQLFILSVRVWGLSVCESLCSDVQYYPLSNNFPSSKSHMFTNWFYMTCSHTHTGTRLQRLILGLDSHNLQWNGDDNWSIDVKLTISFHYKRSQSLSQGLALKSPAGFTI